MTKQKERHAVERSLKRRSKRTDEANPFQQMSKGRANYTRALLEAYLRADEGSAYQNAIGELMVTVLHLARRDRKFDAEKFIRSALGLFEDEQEEAARTKRPL